MRILGEQQRRRIRQSRVVCLCASGFLLLLPLLSAIAAYPQETLTFAGTTVVGATSQPASVPLTVQTAGTVASVVALTSGEPNLDFAVSGDGTCSTSVPMNSGQSCTVSVTFAPRFPGIRAGAVLLESASGQVLAFAPLSGIGQGSLPVLVPGEINTVAGDGQWVYHGDGVAATEAPIFLPIGLAVDAGGNLFLCDSENNRIRRVDATSHLISTVAGNGTSGSSGDGLQATAAELSNPSGLVLDGAGNLYIADTGNSVIRRVDAVSHVITTVAGTLGSSGYAGDGYPGTSAKLSAPQGLALTTVGNLVIADSGNSAIRLLDLSTGQITTVAGNGTAGFFGDGGSATLAQLNTPYGVAISANGMAIADTANQRVRFVDMSGIISTVAGTGQRSYGGDSQPAIQAQLDSPAAVAFDPAGDLFIADSGNNRVRGVFGSPGIIVTLAGTGDEGFAGDGGPDDQAGLYGPYALIFDPGGNLWISDMFHNRVREVSGSQLSLVYPAMKVGKTSPPIEGTLYNAGNATLILGSPTLNQAALDPGTTSCNESPMAPMVSCTMGIDFAPTVVGNNVTGSVSWVSNAPNVTPVDALSGQVLSVEPTTTTLASNANPGLLGQPVTLIATVTSANNSFTGAVTFTEGSTTWCSGVSVTPDGNGKVTASCSIPSLSLGTHTFVATYSGDNDDAASPSQPYAEVIKQQPALALGVSTSPAVVTSNVTLTLTAQDQSGTPTGSVTFYDGTTTLATVNLDGSGRASWSTQTLSVGTHNLSAQYSGDSANAAGTSNIVAEQITQAGTVSVLASSNSTPTVGAAILLTANVVSNSGPAPTGSVQFTDGAGGGAPVIASATLGANGMASASISTLAPGTHNVVAVYSGDSDSASSSSSPIAISVQQIATVTTMGADVNPLNAGATLHLTAIVTMAPGASADGTLSGTVTFNDGPKVLGAAPINATGQASLAVSTLSVGSHAIVASFAGSTNYSGSHSTAINEVVQQTLTETTLGSASATTLAGKPATFTATVTSATGVPTGTITFHDGPVTLGTAILNGSGSASLSSSALSVGAHAITAVYSGDSNYEPSNSSALQQVVQLAQATVSLSGPGSTVDAGLSAQFLVTLTTPGVAPTGTVTLLDGASTIGSATVAANGSFPFSAAHLAVGNHTIIAVYSGDANNAAAQSAAISIMVKQANTTTSLASSANPLTRGAALTITATVVSDSPNPSGQVTLFDGSVTLGSVAVNGNGNAVFPVSTLALGTHNLTAVYAGDTNHLESTSAALPELVVQSATATLTSSVNPSASGQNVVFTAQFDAVAGAAGTPAPTGSAIFRDNGAVLATVPLNGAGAAAFSTAALRVGTHTISVSYAGDNNFAAANAQLAESVIDAATTVTLAASANPATYGQPLSLTATVGSNGGTATGTVSFLDSGTSIGSAQLNAGGVAVLTVATLAPGSHTVTAAYVGDGKASPSASTPVSFVIKQVTGLTVSVNNNPALTLSAVTIIASINSPGAAPVTGTVTFMDGAASLGTAAVDGSGHATLNLPSLSAGTHTLSASYPGDGANFPSKAGAYTETVQVRPTTTSVTGSSTDLSNPQQVTLIAVVKGDGSIPPSGTVSFNSGDITLGVAPVDDTGVADITVIFSATSEPVVASYSGDASYGSSQSSSTAIAAGQPAQFTLNVNAPSITLVTHQHTTVNVAIGSVKGFTDTIALGCLGLPYAATCTFTSPKLDLAANGAAATTLVVDTGDPLGAGTGTNASASPGQRTTMLCWLPLGLLFGLGWRKRTLRGSRGLGLLLLLALGVGLASSTLGCSGLSTSGTPAGTYTFKVVGTGQGSGITQTETVTLVVTQ